VSKMRFFLTVSCLAWMVVASAHAGHRSAMVLKSGEIRPVSQSLHGQLMNDQCDQNPDLMFVFTEQVSSDGFQLEAGVDDQGQISLQVSIDLACDSGSAAFEYGHETSGDFKSSEIQISPLAPVLSVSLQAGASNSTTIGYSLLSGRVRSATARLKGDRITFIAGGTFGQASDPRELAVVRFIGDVIDPSILDGTNRRLRDAGTALNRACRQAPAGSDFAAVCDEIREHAMTRDQQLQAVNAFDAHGLAATPQAAGEGPRLQQSNVRDRLSQIRSGGPNMSFSQISVSFNGQRFDQSWLPTSLQMNEEPEGSRLLGDRWGVFVNGNVSLGSRSERDKEVGFDFDTWGLTGGVDYRFDNGAVAGLALGYSKYDADIDADGGSLDGDTYSVQLFGSLDLATNLYADLTAGYAHTDFSQRRVVDLSGIGSLTRQVSRGSTSSDQWSGSMALNYRILFDNGMNITPYGQYYVARVKIDGFSEQGSVFDYRYPNQSYTSKIWSAGLRGSRAFNLQRAIMMPFVDLSYQYQAGIDSYIVQPTLTSLPISGAEVEISDPDRSFGQLDAGVSWVLPSGNQFFVSYSGLLFERDTTRHSFFVGGRWEF
jgi:outer membrane autotransporter protein